MLASLFASVALALPVPASLPAAAPEVVAVQAGTIINVTDKSVDRYENGTIVFADGRVIAIGSDVTVPAGARVVDYGPDATIVPGFVASNSEYGRPAASARTADPGVHAVDNFDPYASYRDSLAAGVTSAYLAPGRSRLIAGQGAMVKLYGEAGPQRVLQARASLHGSIGTDARTPGYWEPPIPATVDVGLGVAEPQLPRTTMGAIVALGEVLALARGEGSEESAEAYGSLTGPVIQSLVKDRVPWRMGAQSAAEIRALLEFFGQHKLPLVIEGAQGAESVAAEIAAARVPVIVEPRIATDRSGRDFGKSEDAVWPEFRAAAALAKAGARIVFATPPGVSSSHLRYAAGVAARGGLAPDVILRGITLEPARVHGVAQRVGSLAIGKDADFVVLGGSDFDLSAPVMATWVGGEVAWKAHESSTVVVEVEELHVGDGVVMSPGQVLLRDGRIAEVGRRVSHPLGATVVRGFAAMPGMIDAMGHLGLEGSSKTPPIQFPLSRIVEPGDYADKRVAQAGVTTVVLSPRKALDAGTRMMAYKPACEDVEKMVIADPNAVGVTWSNRNRALAGAVVRDVLAKTRQYHAKWLDYEKKLAKWTPPKPAPESRKEKDAAGDDESDEKDDKEDDDKKASDDKKDDGKSKKKKKKKKKKKDEPAKPITGVWGAEVAAGGEDGVRLRLRLLDEEGELSGSLRCEALSSDLVTLEGKREKLEVVLDGDGSRGELHIEAESDNEGKLKGTVALGEESIEFEAKQTSSEYKVAKRPERRREKSEAADSPAKGAPKSPGVDAKLEPFRQAMLGNATVVCGVDRVDEILACVEAFEAVGIRPVLLGAADAWKVADELRGRVAGVLLSHRVVRTNWREDGDERHNVYADLQSAGIPVAFHSAAEEGAADLPLMASYAVSLGMSHTGALKALTADAAQMLSIDDRVGRLAEGLDGDVLLLDGPPLDPATSVLRAWVNGREIR